MPVQRDPDAARGAAMSAGDEMLSTGGRHMRLTTRQRELNQLWSYFRAEEHDGKGVDWDGRKVISPSMRDAISREQFMPPGYEPAGDSLPRDCRRPIAPFAIVHNIVSRFTGMLFSHRRLPRINVPGDQKTEDYLHATLQHGQFWPAMYRARNHGGAMGSACVGFRFLQGHCAFETLDPRWTEPEFIGRGYTDLTKLTVQYTYSQEEKQEDGKYKAVWYWYRREIDAETDTIWVPVRCREKEPRWDFIQRNTVRHGLGFLPYEWIQNRGVDDETDGDSDCMGAYDMVRAIDNLISEAIAGTLANSDPTLLITTAKDFSSLKKGSDNAIKLAPSESASYLELQGSGPKIALEVAKEIEERIYRLAQCVPDSVLFQNSGEKTAVEIERIFSSMFERADSLREQYGPPIQRICQKLLQAVRQHTALREIEDPETGEMRLFRGRVYVPPRVIQQPDGDSVEIPRVVGKGTVCEVRWPTYQRPSYNDMDVFSRVITTILGNDPKLMTKTTAMQLLAPVMDFDPLKELHSLKKEEEDTANAEAAAEGEGGEGESAGPEAANNPATWKVALDGGLITLNEYREMALGLGAIPDGDLTMPQYRAKFANTFVASTASVSEKSVDVATGKLEADEQRAQANEERSGESHEMKAEMHEESKKDRKKAREAPATSGPPGASPSGGGGTSPSPGKPGSPPKRPSSAPAKPSSGSAPPAAPTK